MDPSGRKKRSCTLTSTMSARNRSWLPSSWMEWTRQLKNAGASATAGAALRPGAAMGVRPRWANLSTSRPLFTPQKSIARHRARLVRLSVNSPVRAIMS